MSKLNLLILNIMIHQFMIILFLKLLIFQKTNKNVSKLLDIFSENCKSAYEITF